MLGIRRNWFKSKLPPIFIVNQNDIFFCEAHLVVASEKTVNTFHIFGFISAETQRIFFVNATFIFFSRREVWLNYDIAHHWYILTAFPQIIVTENWSTTLQK